jgi:hypothetical protein
MGLSVFPTPVESSFPPLTIPVAAIPPGLTLRNTYTSSTSGLTFPVENVFAVLIGAGGGGGGGSGVGPTAGGGGGCGSVIAAWIPAPSSVTIGAGGTGGAGGSNNGSNGSSGGSTSVNTLDILVSGGGPGAQGQANSAVASNTGFRMSATTSYNNYASVAGSSTQRGNINGDPANATAGFIAGSGGRGGALGGASTFFNFTPSSSGGAGAIANGSGKNGGSGGGGAGGGGAGNDAGGDGGSGAVLIYY